MRATFAWSASETSVIARSLRLVLVSFDVRMWRILDWPRLILPVPVFLKRFAAPLCVFNLGILLSGCRTLQAISPRRDIFQYTAGSPILLVIDSKPSLRRPSRAFKASLAVRTTNSFTGQELPILDLGPEQVLLQALAWRILPFFPEQ
jgi:hypothetical protein